MLRQTDRGEYGVEPLKTEVHLTFCARNVSLHSVYNGLGVVFVSRR